MAVGAGLDLATVVQALLVTPPMTDTASHS